jgi:hypothetical protein
MSRASEMRRPLSPIPSPTSVTSVTSQKISSRPASQRTATEKIQSVLSSREQIPVIAPPSPPPYRSTKELKPERSTYSTIQNLFDGESVEHVLSSKGFSLEKVVVIDEDGTLQSPYAVAIAPTGHQVFISLDDGGYVPTNETTVVKMRISEKSDLPHSIKTGLIACASYGSGAVYDYGTGVCVINSTPEREERNLNILDDGGSLYLRESSKSYPLVKISDIMSSPDDVSNIIDDFYDVIQRDIFTKSIDTLNQLKSTIGSLRQNSDKLMCIWNKLIDELDAIRTDTGNNLIRSRNDGKMTAGLLENLNQANVLISKTLEISQFDDSDMTHLSHLDTVIKSKVDQLNEISSKLG